MRLISSLLLSLSICAVTARADTILIPNGDFSSPDASGGYTSSISDFNQTGPGGSGTQTPTIGAGMQFTQATPGGDSQVAYSNPNGAAGTTQSFVSSSSVGTINSALSYDLSIYVGNRADYSSESGTYTVDFYDNGVDVAHNSLVVTDTGANQTVPLGQYAQLSVNYTPLGVGTGDPITVGFSYTNGASSHQGIFADFTLTTSRASVPEPSTYALLGVGLLALGMGWRRQMRRS